MDSNKLVVVGQGYVGLPVSMRAVQVGFDVVGIDNDLRRTTALQNGESFVEDISNEEVQNALDSGRYRPTCEYSLASDFDFAIISVPTPLHEGVPDLTFIESSTRSLGKYLRSGATVVLESTTYPGTTEELVVPILEETSGLTAGTDFFVGYSPERIDPGNSSWNFVNTPKVISGIDEHSLEKVNFLYSQLVNTTIPTKGTAEAELTKLLENTFRHVNIALVNELAIFANQLGVDIWDSINAAASKPFGFMKFTPGPGVGGHCLPVDPSYLSWQVRRKLGRNFRFVELANDINDHMPDFVVQRAAALLNQRGVALSAARILLLGLAYKKNSGDSRESPSKRIIDLFLDQDVTLSAIDNHVNELFWPKSVLKETSFHPESSNFDLVVIITDHDDINYQTIVDSQVQILDTRNIVEGNNVEQL